MSAIVTLLLDLDAEQVERIIEVADATGRSRLETIRALIDDGLRVASGPLPASVDAVEPVVDPRDADILHAAMAAFERLPDDLWLDGANDGERRLRAVR